MTPSRALQSVAAGGLFALVGVLLHPAVASAQGPACCVENPGPGCGDTTCEGCVCAFDLVCCNVDWDSVCVGEAVSICPLECGCAAALAETLATSRNSSDHRFASGLATPSWPQWPSGLCWPGTVPCHRPPVAGRLRRLYGIPATRLLAVHPKAVASNAAIGCRRPLSPF